MSNYLVTTILHLNRLFKGRVRGDANYTAEQLLAGPLLYHHANNAGAIEVSYVDRSGQAEISIRIVETDFGSAFCAGQITISEEEGHNPDLLQDILDDWFFGPLATDENLSLGDAVQHWARTSGTDIRIFERVGENRRRLQKIVAKLNAAAESIRRSLLRLSGNSVEIRFVDLCNAGMQIHLDSETITCRLIIDVDTEQVTVLYFRHDTHDQELVHGHVEVNPTHSPEKVAAELYQKQAVQA
jgi:hypothetical protein